MHFYTLLRMNLISEAYPFRSFGVSKIIQGDLRERSWVVDGVTYKHQNTDGILMYDRRKPINRPWFVIAYESGRRIVD